MRPNGQTACGAIARVTIDKPTIRKSIPTNGYGILSEFSRTKPINSALVDVSPASARYNCLDRDVRTNTRGLATFTV